MLLTDNHNPIDILSAPLGALVRAARAGADGAGE
jgi:hypothetical protein